MPISITTRSVAVINRKTLLEKAVQEADFLRKLLIENEYVMISGFFLENKKLKLKEVKKVVEKRKLKT